MKVIEREPRRSERERTQRFPPEGRGELTPEEIALSRQIHNRVQRVSLLLQGAALLGDEEKREVERLLRALQQETERLEGRFHSYFDPIVEGKIQRLFPTSEFARMLRESGSARFIDSLRLHVDGEASIQAILRHIRSARKSIRIWMYIWADDETGNEVAQALLDAADRGVKITIHKDKGAAVFERTEGRKQSMFHKGMLGVGLKTQKKALEWMYPNKEVSGRQRANPLAKRLMKHRNVTIERSIRNDHSKVFIFDDEVLMTGGVNVSDIARKQMHDYMVEVKSRVKVAEFLSRLQGKEKKAPAQGSSLEFALNVNSGGVRKREIKPLMLALIRSAQSELVIQMAYFGDRDVTEEIIRAANRGVRVIILTSEKANLQNDLNRKILRRILRRTRPGGVEVILTRITHAKVVHVDGRRTFIGSANMNTTATKKLGETNLFINDAQAEEGRQSKFTEALQRQLRQDMLEGRHIRSPKELSYGRAVAKLEGVAAA